MIPLLFALMSAASLWLLREGRPPEAPVTSVYVSTMAGAGASMSTGEIRDRLAAGDQTMVFPLAARLMSEGRSSEAMLYWRNAHDPPATRAELLSALAWYGRYLLHDAMGRGGTAPDDLREKMHEYSFTALQLTGLMTTRLDGLFHGGSLVTRADIYLLIEQFPVLGENMSFLPMSYLETAFRSPPGGSR